MSYYQNVSLITNDNDPVSMTYESSLGSPALTLTLAPITLGFVPSSSVRVSPD